MGGLLSRLERYSLVIMDEVHERHVATDMLLGLLKLVALRRRDFRLVVMSATMDPELFIDFFQRPVCGEGRGDVSGRVSESNQSNQSDLVNLVNESNQSNQSVLVNLVNESNLTNQSNQSNLVNESNQLYQTNQSNLVNQSNQSNQSNLVNPSNLVNMSTQINPPTPSTPLTPPPLSPHILSIPGRTYPVTSTTLPPLPPSPLPPRRPRGPAPPRSPRRTRLSSPSRHRAGPRALPRHPPRDRPADGYSRAGSLPQTSTSAATCWSSSAACRRSTRS